MINRSVTKRLVLFSFIKATAAAVVLLAASNAAAWAAGDVTCSGGSIASGIYSSLKIAGTCTVDSGPVTVEHNLTVLPNATLIAVAGGVDGFGIPVVSSDLTVGGNLDVQAGGVLTLGCESIFFTCPNDPAFPSGGPGTYATQHTVAGNLTADNALSLVIHHTNVFGNLSVRGGGGGLVCAFLPGRNVLPYGDFENMTIGGDFSVTGWQSCWLGVFRVSVSHSLTLNGNTTLDPDGNETAHNTVIGNLNCSGNSPSNQMGDSAAGLNMVLGNANGQCSELVAH